MLIDTLTNPKHLTPSNFPRYYNRQPIDLEDQKVDASNVNTSTNQRACGDPWPSFFVGDSR